jgi:hypothetical protein
VEEAAGRDRGLIISYREGKQCRTGSLQAREITRTLSLRLAAANTCSEVLGYLIPDRE